MNENVGLLQHILKMFYIRILCTKLKGININNLSKWLIHVGIPISFKLQSG